MPIETVKSGSGVQRVKRFPKLMVNQHGGSVVLFTSMGCGTVVHQAGDNALGYFSDKWLMETFKDFNEDLVLRNL